MARLKSLDIHHKPFTVFTNWPRYNDFLLTYFHNYVAGFYFLCTILARLNPFNSLFNGSLIFI